MTRTVPAFLTFSDSARRALLGIAVIQMLAVALPAHAETAAGSAGTTAPAAAATAAPVPVQATLPPQPDRISGDYVKGYLNDTGKILASPANWNGSDWLKTGLVIGAASGLYFVDADIRDLSRRNQSSVGDKGAAIGNALGNPLYTLPPLGLFYLYGSLNDDPKARRTSLLAVESLAISGAFTWTLKVTAQRPRPFTGESPSTWNGPSLNTGDYSFPSGHTTAAFSIASVLAEEYGTNPFVPPVAYGLASLTGFARIYDDKHWASDVFIGGAIGYFVGKAVVHYHTTPGDNALKLLPAVSRQGVGLMAEYRF